MDSFLNRLIVYRLLTWEDLLTRELATTCDVVVADAADDGVDDTMLLLPPPPALATELAPLAELSRLIMDAADVFFVCKFSIICATFCVDKLLARRSDADLAVISDVHSETLPGYGAESNA